MKRLRCLRAAAALSLSAIAATAGARAGPLDDAIRKAASAANPSGTPFRVGLGVGHRLMLKSDRPYRLVDPATQAPVWKESYSGEIAVIAQGGPEEEPASIYRIQVGAFASAEAAEAERASLERSTGAPAVVRYLPDRGSWRVRVGEAKTRTGLSSLLATLRDAGRKGMWIAEETAPAPPGVTIRLVDAAWDTQATTATRLLALPAPGGWLQLEGKPYRGALEFRVDASGRIRAIDWVELESYLRGVVPAEMGPEVWPQLEALKAQAVAARTYALANALQFDEDGYDICATPRCQAYGGVSAEHPLSDRAVAETRGEIASWQGRPIDALYTATCGGHTEDAKEIFPEQAAPYLVGVPCRAEEAALARTRRVLKGAAPAAVETENGEDVTRDVYLLDVAGVFGPPGSKHLVKDLGKPVKAATLRSWTTALCATRGTAGARRESRRPLHDPQGRAGLGHRSRLARAHRSAPDRRRSGRGAPRCEGGVSSVRRAPSADLPRPARRAPSGPGRALAAGPRALRRDDRRGLGADRGGLRRLRPGRGNRRVGRRARAVRRTRTGECAAAPGGLSAAVHRGGPAELPRGGAPALAGRSRAIPHRPRRAHRSARAAPAQQGVVGRSLRGGVRLGGAEVRCGARRGRGQAGRRSARSWICAWCGAAPPGASSSCWSSARRGAPSSRASTCGTCSICGRASRSSSCSATPSGRIRSAVFAGKGWGHGVGLCQVGAYGMAMRGSDYKEILAHYYPGTTLTKGDSAGAPVAGVP